MSTTKKKSSMSSKSSKSSKSEKTTKPVKKEKVKIKLKARKQEFNGKPTFSIWEVNAETGEDIREAPIIAFGETKARAILKCHDKLKLFVSELDDAKNSEKSSG